MSNKKYHWPDVEYGSAEYHRRWREANAEKSRAYHREYDRKMYRLHPEREKARRQRYIDKYPERIKANQKVRDALRYGKLEKRPCVECNNIQAVAHHDDWSKPLDVVWLCEIHHKARHRQVLAQSS